MVYRPRRYDNPSVGTCNRRAVIESSTSSSIARFQRFHSLPLSFDSSRHPKPSYFSEDSKLIQLVRSPFPQECYRPDTDPQMYAGRSVHQCYSDVSGYREVVAGLLEKRKYLTCSIVNCRDRSEGEDSKKPMTIVEF